MLQVKLGDYPLVFWKIRYQQVEFRVEQRIFLHIIPVRIIVLRS